MKVMYIYNKHNKSERDLKCELNNRFSQYMINIEYKKISDLIHIRSTPALVIIKDNLQGDNLLEKDMANNKFRATLEIAKALDDEDKIIHNIDSGRIDAITNKKVLELVDNITLEVIESIDRGVKNEGISTKLKKIIRKKSTNNQ